MELSNSNGTLPPQDLARKLPPEGISGLIRPLSRHVQECAVVVGLLYAGHFLRPEIWALGLRVLVPFYGLVLIYLTVNAFVWRIPTFPVGEVEDRDGSRTFDFTLIPYLKASAVLLLLAYSGGGYREQIWTVGHWVPVAVLVFGIALASARSAAVRAAAAWITHHACPVCGAAAIGNQGFGGPDATVDVECKSCGRLIRFSTSGVYFGYIPRRRWKALAHEPYHNENYRIMDLSGMGVYDPRDSDDPDEFPQHNKE